MKKWFLLEDSINTIEFKNSYIICPQSENILWDKNLHLKNKKGSKKFKEIFPIIVELMIIFYL